VSKLEADNLEDFGKGEGVSAERSAPDDLDDYVNVPEPQLSEDEPDSQVSWITVLGEEL